MATYTDRNFCSWREVDDGQTEQMANFVAEIDTETRIVDGINSRSKLKITGRKGKEKENGDIEADELPAVEIDAENFSSLGWVMPLWGVKAIIRPGSSIKDDLRTYIQLRSNPKIKTIYQHTGWTKINGKDAYLHAGGAILASGNDPTVSVRLQNELSRFDLSSDADRTDAAKATLQLLELADGKIIWPLLATTFAPIFGQVDFATHVAGRTGTYKSEMTSLFQSHYGSKMDARHLPGSWSSTANALEAQAFYACNAVFTIDDFVPQGTSWQVRAYQQNADKIIRAQGNQAGRARLSDLSNLQQTMYPRGVILSSGEDIPEGHSVRARLMIIDLTPGDVKIEALTKAQANRSKFPATTAGLIQFICDKNISLNGRVEELRNAYRSIGHSRTPNMLGRLIATAEAFLEYCRAIKAIDDAKFKSLKTSALHSIEEQGGKQITFLEDSDPCDMFANAIRQIFATGLAHMRSLQGGVPSCAKIVGWIQEHADSEMPVYKSRGNCIGWVNADKNEMYIDITSGFNIIKKVAGAELSLTKQTLMKRLKDAGMLSRVDESRQRNTIRINADGHPRNVLCMKISDTLEESELDHDDE